MSVLASNPRQQTADLQARARKGQAFIYTCSKTSTVHLFAPLGTVSRPALRKFFRARGNPRLIAPQSTLRDRGFDGGADKFNFNLPCTWSFEGLTRLIENIKNSKMAAPAEGLLPVQVVDESQIFHRDDSASRLFEFAMHLHLSPYWVLDLQLVSSSGRACTPRQLQKLSVELSVPMVNDSMIEVLRSQNQRLIQSTSTSNIQLLAGRFKLHSLFSEIDHRYHWAFVSQHPPRRNSNPLVRIESECLTGHLLGSQLCDCGAQLHSGLEKIQQSDGGVLVYLRQEGRGIGLLKKIQAYHLQQKRKLDTVDANLALGLPDDARDYIIGAQILHHLGISKLRLLTNNPKKVEGLQRYGIKVSERVSHVIPPSHHNQDYLETKRLRLGHWL